MAPQPIRPGDAAPVGPNSGAASRLFSEVAENADLKPVEGLSSVGASWGQQMWLGVIPQVAPNWVSYALMRFEINVRASTIIGAVGGGGRRARGDRRRLRRCPGAADNGTADDDLRQAQPGADQGQLSGRPLHESALTFEARRGLRRSR